MVTNNSWNSEDPAQVAKGGTGATSLADFSVLLGSGTSAITPLGPTSTAGQVLQSAGAAADPAFSTATYPLTTANNEFLYSTATNTVSSFAASKGTVHLSADVTNVTGDGTDYKVAFNTVFYDVGNDWDTTNFNLVIPRTGFYLFIGNITYDTGLTSSNTEARMYISIPSHSVFIASEDPGNIVLGDGTTYNGSYIALLASSALVNLHIFASGSTKTAGLRGGTGNLQTFFSWTYLG